MFVWGIDDIIGIILLGGVAVYAIYIFLSNDRSPKTPSKDGQKAPDTRKKSDPKTLKALAVIGVFFIIAVAVALFVAKK